METYEFKVSYDHTIRDANENIIQYSYGDDGLDISKTEGGKINVLRLIQETIGGSKNV